MKLYFLLLTIGCLGGCSAFAQQATSNPAGFDPVAAAGRTIDEKQAAINPTYSVAVALGRDPHERLAEYQARVCSGSLPRPCPDALAWAAKAALEAGENQTAHDYAVEALQSADAVAARYGKRGFKAPRSLLGAPTADYYGNFVLGRLAVLGGDIRSAERYLLVSGKTIGDPALMSFGPNMSLAFEVLKHGDSQSRQVVLQYLDEVRTFWHVDQSSMDKWAAQIVAGDTPTFRVGDGSSRLYN
jgi:hypothetical protein